MGKRLIDTSLWNQNKWFRKLKPEFKLLWIYLFCNCDSVGVWEEDLELASFIIGIDFTRQQFDDIFSDKIKWINKKKVWLIDFCNFQYGTLKEENITNKPHQSYINLLKKHSLWIDYTKTIQSHKEKEIDKEEDIDKDNDKEIEEQFEIFRQGYPGTKNGHDVEFLNLTKKHKDWREIVPILFDRINYQMVCRAEKEIAGGFIPEWKNLKTWINQRCWEEEIAINNISNGTKKTIGANPEELARLTGQKIGVTE
jgi:hypothetical protein